LPVWLLNVSVISKKWFDRINTLSSWSIRPFIFINVMVKQIYSLVDKIKEVFHSK
jgi:hypothetical protein